MKRSRWKSWAGTGLALAFIAGFIYMVASAILAPAPKYTRHLQPIALVQPPLPPPPPPEPPPPPPEMKEEEVPDEPEAEAPPAENLGVDADASGSGDGFGLVARKGGRDLLDGSPFGSYKTLLAADVKSAIDGDRRLRKEPYRVLLSLWIGRDGRVERVELDSSTGDPALDKSLRTALAELRNVREVPPLEMPQPVKLRIVSRL
jgi:protein TonB